MFALFNEYRSAKKQIKKKMLMHELKNTYCSLILLKTITFQKIFSKNCLNMVKKLNFVKEYKTVVRSSHPPLEIVIITYKGTVVKANPLSKLLMLMPTHQFLPKQYIYIYIY